MGNSLTAAALIGHTGFVGGNLARQARFGHQYNSANIADIRGREFDLLVCSGVSAVKWWANKNPAEDLARIDSLLGHLAAVQAARVIVLSTVDVYPVTSGVDELCNCHASANHAYGTNRLHFEDRVSELFSDVTVTRISGMFGPGLKKNVIYDLIHDNCLDAINPASSFQYYNVANLWRDLERVREADLKLVNFVAEPISTGDIIRRVFPGKPVGQNAAPEVHYDVQSLHSSAFGGPPRYLATAETVMRELAAYMTGACA